MCIPPIGNGYTKEILRSKRILPASTSFTGQTESTEIVPATPSLHLYLSLFRSLKYSEFRNSSSVLTITMFSTGKLFVNHTTGIFGKDLRLTYAINYTKNLQNLDID